MTPNVRGILLMIAAMAGFAVEDAVIKLASATLPAGQILLMIGGGGALVFTAAARLQGTRVLHRSVMSRALLLRSGFEVVSSASFVTALTLIPLSTASAILQAAPIVVTAGAAIFLGETVGWRRWAAVLIGFAGVLLILRPGADAFDPAALWAVLGTAALAGRDLVTRRMAVGLPTAVVAAWGFAASALVGALLLALSGGATLPAPPAAALIATALTIGIFGYWAIIEATRAGDVSIIAPFRYARLPFGMILGIVLFRERIDIPMLLGAGIVVGSGLYTLYRERRRRLEVAATAPHRPEARP